MVHNGHKGHINGYLLRFFDDKKGAQWGHNGGTIGAQRVHKGGTTGHKGTQPGTKGAQRVHNGTQRQVSHANHTKAPPEWAFWGSDFYI